MQRQLQGPNGASGASSAANISGSIATILANPYVGIAAKDSVEIGPGGFAYSAKVTDYAAVANAGTSIVAPTSLTGSSTLLSLGAHSLVILADGSIVTYAPVSTSYGLQLNRYSPAGALISTCQVIGVSLSPLCYYPRLALLTNGNMAVVYSTVTSNLYYAVVNAACSALVAGPTLIDALNSDISEGGPSSLLALSGGGFAVAYNYSSNEDVKVVIYNNSGGVVSSATSVVTWGTGGASYPKLAQLSNGNIAVVVFSYATTSLYLTIISNVGAVVVAQATVDAGVTTYAGVPIPEISVLTGYFAIAQNVSSSISVRAYVYSNSGALQGSAYALGSGASAIPRPKLVNDGVSFWLLNCGSGSTATLYCVQISTAGVVVQTLPVTWGGTGFLDAFFENGRAIIATFGLGSGFYWLVVNLTTGVIENSGTLSATPNYVSVRPGGDSVFVAAWGGSGVADAFAVVKYANTAFLGVSQTLVDAGALAAVAIGSGVYQANAMNGSPTKTFNHNATNIVGNAGALLAQGVVLTGI